ncbi:MAG: translation initiation factor IF-2 [Verrucomicrobiota bacterium]|nr:translation initiation factor IF-2 [Limisphaera sp.]MDW8382670.1 translation initiation factor IF-2 [Verrucomicrobiota bacterium]
MPVRIYEISRRLGLDNKEVLAKAKELGLTGVRAASSTLDKITAEYFEAELRKAFAERIAARQLAEAEAAAKAAAGSSSVENLPAEPEVGEREAPPPTSVVVPEGVEVASQPEPGAEVCVQVVGAVEAVKAQPPAEALQVSTTTFEFATSSQAELEASPLNSAQAAEPAPLPEQVAEGPRFEAAPLEAGASPIEPSAPKAPEPVIVEESPRLVSPTVGPSASPTVNGIQGAAPLPGVTSSAPAASAISKEPAPQTASGLTQPRSEAVPTGPALPPPPQPARPKVGDKIGFISLPPRPQSKSPAKPVAPSPPPKATPAPAKVQPPKAAPVTTKSAPPKAAPGSKGPEKPAAGINIRVVAPAAREEKEKSPAKPAGPTPGRLGKVELPPNAPVVSLKPPISVRALAEKLNQKAFKIIADLMDLGIFANVNQTMDADCARAICAKYGYRFELEKRERHAPGPVAPVRRKQELDPTDRPEDLRPRAPVVTIMGHVDHGKTTLLDAIRKSNVAAREAGGITQHIGAYTISFPHPERKGQLAQITFLDTPGHAAFSAMRARGANVTDIVVLVVAADDGVMPQTLEALNHARAAGVPVIVAVNKIDHPLANPMKVRQQLQEQGLVPDDWGGDTIFVDLSALTKKGVDKLLEMILLQADLLELKANPNRPAVGNIIESGISPGGPTATALVRKGTLRVGDALLCGPYYGKVRALINEDGQRLKEAGPSVAVKVLGLNGVPEPGSEFTVVEDERKARELAEQRLEALRAKAPETRAKVTLENLFQVLDAQQAKVLKVVIKADTQGSVEAIVDALKKIDSEKVKLEIIHSAVGTITESDVLLASASNAVVIGFHTRVDTGAQEIAKREGVQIKLYSIIYELIDQVREAMAGLLEPVTREVVLGAAEVKQIFPLSKGPPVAGCMVVQGRITKGRVRVRRRKDVIFEGMIQSIRRFQDEVAEVRAGLECGIRLDGFGDFQVGDLIECYTVEKVAQTL